MDNAEQFAERYLLSRSLRPNRFNKQEMRQGKTPDFRVFKQDELVAYCEAKHVEYDQWLDNEMEKAPETIDGLRIAGGPRPDPIYNRLETHIHRAAKQFAAVNSAHNLPNFLVFVNSDRHCDFQHDLIGVLTGNAYVEGGGLEGMFAEYSDGRILYEKMTIDVYVWWDSWRNEERPRLWFWRNSSHYLTASALLGSDTSTHRKVS
jgi:hypothetical protein